MTSPLVSILAQANKPAAAPTPATLYPTNVASIYNNYDQAQMDAYKAQIAQQNAQFGGLASLGSAGISALPKLLGGLGTAGAAGAGADISASALAGLEALGSAAII